MAENMKMDPAQKNVVSEIIQNPEGSVQQVDESVLVSVSRVIDRMRLHPDQTEMIRMAKEEAARQWEQREAVKVQEREETAAAAEAEGREATAAVEAVKVQEREETAAAAEAGPAAETAVILKPAVRHVSANMPKPEVNDNEAAEEVKRAAEVMEDTEAIKKQENEALPAAKEQSAEEIIEEKIREDAEETIAATAPEEDTVETAVIPNQDQNPARINMLKFGLQPVLPYSIEEAINRLRINISFLGSDVKKIMVVSSEPNEGKSFVAMNLWKQMAMAGESTVLLDLDMRKSTMAAKYQMYREDGQELQGASHYLAGDIPIEDMILHTDMPTGDILPNVDNIVNPSMLFESRKFTEMMTYAQESYRYIFVDVPPLGLVSDGELIGSFCDGAVLCVRAGVTSRGIIRHSIQQMERAGCPVLGIVLNRVGAAGGGYYHKYYGKRYYYNDQYYSKG